MFEVKKDLRVGNVREDAVEQLAGYVRQRTDAMNQRYVGVLTDGAEWHAVPPRGRGPGGSCPPFERRHRLRPTSRVSPSGSKARSRRPSASCRRHARSTRRLGAASPAHALDSAELAALYDANRDHPTVQAQARALGQAAATAFGTNFADDDSLFVDHTLLVAMAEVIAHAVVGFDPGIRRIASATLMSGQRSPRRGSRGVVEADFFDWIVEVPGGDRFVKSLARRLTRFAWDDVEHDVMKVLYESRHQPPRPRHHLGEYYTPDWLAEEIVDEVVDDPLDAARARPGVRLRNVPVPRRAPLPRSCRGRRHRQTPRPSAASPRTCIGVDVHPVAVTLARVTYLLAIGVTRLQADDRPPFAVPVYLGDCSSGARRPRCSPTRA